MPEPSALAPAWSRWDDIPVLEPTPGVHLRAFTGTALMACRFVIDPHSDLSRHDHPNEQLGVVLEGALTLTIADETRTLRPGDVFAIPPGVPHGAVTGPEGCTVLDLFTPPREDFRQT